MQPEKDSRVESNTPATGGDAKTLHTPTPWRCDPDGYAEYIWGASGEMVAQLRGHGAGLPKRDNAEFIVRACNNLDALLESLKELHDASAAMMRTILKIDSTFGPSELECELRKAGIEFGFGLRAQQAIANAEAPHVS